MKKKLALIVMLAISLFMVSCSEGSSKATPTKVPDKNAVKEVDYKMRLFFVDKEIIKMDSEERVVKFPENLDSSQKAKTILDELFKGPNSNLFDTVIPQAAKVLEVKVEQSLAKVDLSQEFETDHIGGSTGTTMSVAQMVLSLTEMPEITSVSFKINGKEVAEFKGHLEFNKPFKRSDFEKLENGEQ